MSRGYVPMNEPAFNDGRFRARHMVALLIHTLLSLFLFWLMAEARVAGGFNIFWLVLALFALVPAMGIAGSCLQPWLAGANEHGWFRVLLFIDCAISVFPMAYIAWLTGAWMLGSWPGFFKMPFQLYSLTVFFETIGGGLLIMGLCALYVWSALRLMFLLLFRRGAISGRDVMGDIAPPDVSPPKCPIQPRDDILSPQFVPPPVRRPEKVESALPKKLPPPTSFADRQARITAVRGISWPGNEADAARARAAGFALLEWNLWQGEAGPRGDAHSVFSVLHGIAHLASDLSPEEARLAVLQVRSLLADGRQPFTDERAADGDGMELERIREQNRTATAVGQVASQVLEHLLACHPALRDEGKSG